MHRSLRLLKPFTRPASASASALRVRPIAVTVPAVFTRAEGTKADKHKDITNHVHHSTPNAAQEARAVVSDFATLIAGKSVQAAQAGGREQATAHGSVSADLSTASTLIEGVPRPIMNFGLLGTVPYLGTSIATVALAREASLASSGVENFSGLDLETALSYLHTVEHVQITYGATILAFLGALHWGMEFVAYGGPQGYRRLILGTLPLLVAWPTTFLSHGVALATQWGAFTGTWMIDQRASTAGWTPSWFSTYRFYLTAIVGTSILFTLGGTSYYGAGSGAQPATGLPHERKRVSSLARLDRVKTRNEGATPETKLGKATGTVGGPIATDSDEQADAYVHIHNVDKEREQQRKEEQERKEKARQQDKKDEHQQDESPDGMKANAPDRTGANANEGKGEGDKKPPSDLADRDQQGKPRENKGERSAKRDDPKNEIQAEKQAEKREK